MGPGVFDIGMARRGRSGDTSICLTAKKANLNTIYNVLISLESQDDTNKRCDRT